jgi:queuine tRNA-ribosyltransferase
MLRSVDWLARCKRAHARPDAQALFGIVQGGTDLALRRESAERTCAIDLPGYAIGGVAVGESPERIAETVRHTAPLLPDDRPRYLMGVGYPRDIAIAVAAGVDMFDCVLPTRNGRNALAFTRAGTLRLRNARFADDPEPIEAGCDCEACAGGFSRAYLRHLFQAGEMLGPTLVSLHNVRLYQRLMLDIRRAIGCNRWSSLAQAWPCLSAAPGDTSGESE